MTQHTTQDIHGGQLHWWTASLPSEPGFDTRVLTAIHNTRWMDDARCDVFANLFINMVPLSSISKADVAASGIEHCLQQAIIAYEAKPYRHERNTGDHT